MRASQGLGVQPKQQWPPVQGPALPRGQSASKPAALGTFKLPDTSARALAMYSSAADTDTMPGPRAGTGGGRARSPRQSKAERLSKVDKVLAKPAEEQLQERVSVLPGVGPRYEQLMKQRNIHFVRDLMTLYVDKHKKDISDTERYLREVVGITRSDSLRNITQYLDQLHKRQSGAAPGLVQPKVTLSVEGNISAGKSTFLRILEGSGLLNTKLQVVPEPVHQWQNVGPERINLLDVFYKEKERFAYTFQNYVFLTRMMKERESYTAAAMCRLLERSVFSDKMVFVRAVHAAQYMSDTELEIYNSWFDPVLSTFPTLVPNGFIYLRANPETCHYRLRKRGRTEETGVSLEYLQELHEKHEDWLYQGGDPVSAGPVDQYIWAQPTQQLLVQGNSPPPQYAGTGGLSMMRPGDRFSIHSHLPASSQSQQRGAAAQLRQLVAAASLPPVPAALDRAIRFLDTSRGAHMHPLLNTVPALVLDCDRDVDVDKDEVYKAEIANQVSLYCDYVREYMLARGTAMSQLDQAIVQHTPSAALRQYNGYSVQVQGSTLYLDDRAPLLAFTQDTSRLATGVLSGSTGLVLPGGGSAARTAGEGRAQQAAQQDKVLQAA